MKKVAVLVVHGIGWHDDGTARGFIDKRLTQLMDPPRSVELLAGALAKRLDGVPWKMRLAHWGKEVEPVQRRFEQSYEKLRWDGARHLAISALGDAAQYGAAVYSGGKPTFPTHQRIHRVVAATLDELARECGDDAPLVAIGHSLGGHILSNHIYDEQRAPSRRHRAGDSASTPLGRMQTLSAVVTLGCNIPLFVMGADAPRPIELGAAAAWLNYYDPDDVLAFPLAPLYFPDGDPKSYALRDIAVEVGGPIAGRTPLSHGYYWDHAEVADGIAHRIRVAAAGEG